MTHETPSFLLDGGALEWDAMGYRFAEPPGVDLLAASTLADGNPWIVFAAALERAKQGRFDGLPVLLRAMRSFKDDVFWRYCAELVGDAGSSVLLKDFVRDFRDELLDAGEPAYQVELAHAFQQSMRLWTVPLILKMYLDSGKREQTGVLSVFLSRLMEPELGPIGVAALPDAEYRELVMAKYEELKLAHGSDEAAVLHGEAFSVRALARHLHAGLSAPEIDEDEIMFERHLFEAATGIDCSAFFDDGDLQPLNAMAIVEEFLEDKTDGLYAQAVRCFWGRGLPD